MKVWNKIVIFYVHGHISSSFLIVPRKYKVIKVGIINTLIKSWRYINVCCCNSLSKGARTLYIEKKEGFNGITNQLSWQTIEFE